MDGVTPHSGVPVYDFSPEGILESFNQSCARLQYVARCSLAPAVMPAAESRACAQ